jgi:REP element-mobilizing transposase RayT
VPSRLKRYYNARHLHFITCSCYRRRPLLGTVRRRNLFLKVLEETRQRYQFVVLGYVVMPEHFHLLMSEPEKADPSVVMKVVKQRFARQVREKGNSQQLGVWGNGEGEAGGPYNFGWRVAHTTRGCPIQSRSVRLSGVSMTAGTSVWLRSSVTYLALRIQVASPCAVPSQALL